MKTQGRRPDPPARPPAWAKAAGRGAVPVGGWAVALHAGEEVGRKPLRHPFLVGRAPAVSLRLADASVSRYHFALLQDACPGTWMVYDLSSTNGLWLNGRRLREPRPLRDGDFLLFGRNFAMVIQL